VSTENKQWMERIRQMTILTLDMMIDLKYGQRKDGNAILKIIEASSRDLSAHCRLNPDRTEDGVVWIAQTHLSESADAIRRHIERRTRELKFPPMDGQTWGDWDGDGPDDEKTNDQD